LAQDFLQGDLGEGATGSEHVYSPNLSGLIEALKIEWWRCF
jgi:hypothetical protein